MSRAKLDFPLVPKSGPILRKDLNKILQVKPMQMLPFSLVPDEDSDSTPPTLHYGWVVDENVLLDFAKQRGITCRMKMRKLHSNEVGEEDESKRYESTNPDILFLLVDALDVKARDLKLTNVPDIPLVIDPSSKDGTSWLVSLIMNHTLEASFIDRADMKKLKDDFKFTDSPMWYLDCCHSRWE